VLRALQRRPCPENHCTERRRQILFAIEQLGFASRCGRKQLCVERGKFAPTVFSGADLGAQGAVSDLALQSTPTRPLCINGKFHFALPAKIESVYFGKPRATVVLASDESRS